MSPNAATTTGASTKLPSRLETEVVIRKASGWNIKGSRFYIMKSLKRGPCLMTVKKKIKNLLKPLIPIPIRKCARAIQTVVREPLLIPRCTISLIGLSQNLCKQYTSINSAEQLAINHTPKAMLGTKSLDLGCGAHIRNPFGAEETFGVDIRNDLSQNIKQADLSAESIPFKDNSFDFCTAFDVIEHIPRNSWPNGEGRLAFIELMNEVHRVLKPGGLFLHSTPAFPSKEAFQDPTHVNIITEDTLRLYFCKPYNWGETLGYGFHGSFELVEQRWISNIWLTGILKAIK